MTPEEQRISIAEACGWVHIEHTTDGKIVGLTSPAMSLHKELPDYLNDLNAVHEAEKVLTLAQKLRFAQLLEIIVTDQCEENFPPKYNDSCFNGKGWYDNDYRTISLMLHATAAQRSRAFLMTLGLWKN